MKRKRPSLASNWIGVGLVWEAISASSDLPPPLVGKVNDEIGEDNRE